MPSVLAVVLYERAKSEALTTVVVNLDSCIILPALPWKAVASVEKDEGIHRVSGNPLRYSTEVSRVGSKGC